VENKTAILLVESLTPWAWHLTGCIHL